MAERKRRQYGTGGVSWDPSKKRWVGTIEAGVTAKGTRRKIKVSGRTEAEAKTRLKERQRKIAAEGLPVEGASARVTVQKWAGEWITRRPAEVRHTSAATDTSQVRKWVIPTIGHRRLDQLTPADVRSVTAAIIGSGLSTSTAQRAQVVLTKMLRDAILEGYDVPQRVLLVPAPAKAVNDRDAISIVDAHAMLAAAATHPDGSRWVAAFLQGMRQGECLGLTWDLVDLDNGTIDISWQLDALPYKVKRDRSSGFQIKPGLPHRHLVDRWHLVPPKTANGQRIIPLVPWMTAALAAWREICPPSKWNLVWPNPDGTPRSEVTDREAWWALQDQAQVARIDDTVGRRYELHEARHTTATLLLEAGVDPKVVEAILGHSTIVTSRGYQHVSQVLARKALDDVAARLGLVPTQELTATTTGDHPAELRFVRSSL
ncbi:tyrosine-type recombinase/integrase [Cellulomonas sp. ES6]|uniref:tyrosine-type recombinase/integrase n=1 Tax=Cellulomonas sp. ES6 TaxID=3039384 RepID=UPI0024B8542C|nr:tyrosine-type recombinase/integrase [Cellulomonas sp. ES6]WHP18802.1 tyrosine-type recombinase/integrase [Cellulomonas sp. ES6]